MIDNIKSMLKTTNDNIKHRESKNLEENNNLRKNKNIDVEINNKSENNNYKFPR